MSKKLVFLIIGFATLLGSNVFSLNSTKNQWAVTVHDHEILNELKNYTHSTIDKARVQVVEFNEHYNIDTIPAHLKKYLKPIDVESVLKAYPDSYRSRNFSFSDFFIKLSARKEIKDFINVITPEAFFERVKFITDFGTRTTEPAISAFVKEFESMGYETKHNFNIEAWKKGTLDPSKFVIVLGHMDTVANTVGADDNASGAAGVLEIAKALKDVESDYSILFMLTEKEEGGLVGSQKFVSYLKKNNLKDKVLFVVNMDMIGYNKNQVVDLETEPEFKSLVEWMATLTKQYTTLTPNIMLHAWASDHVPFINAGIETLLTIEHWETHTPCWHKSCDTLDTINSKYATEILKLNLAATIIKAGVKIP